MMLSINNAVQANYIFIAIFIIALAISTRRKKEGGFFPTSLTQELKGLAILTVVFSHISYFLVADHRFLFPLSIMAGVGVNLFLFLSGYGLTISTLKKGYSAPQFYRRRLIKLFIPLWILLAVFFLLDHFILKINYAWAYVGWSFLGIFKGANLFTDLNASLWYFTLILFYYFIFPLLFFKKRPWLSAIFIYAAGYLAALLNPPFFYKVMYLYEIHIIAFPLGVLVGSMFYTPPLWTKSMLGKLRNLGVYGGLPNFFKQIGRYILIILLLAFVSYTAYHSGVGGSKFMEQIISLSTMLAITVLFLMKKFEIRLLYLLGLYSYEIYLFHWPILYRYDIFFKFMPAWLAMAAYLGLFLGLGWLLKRISAAMSDKIPS